MMMMIVYLLLTKSELIMGKSQTKALSTVKHQGRGLRFPCNYDQTDDVINKIFIIWPC